MIIYFKMLLVTIEQQFFISEGLRIFLSIFILLVLCMPVFYKILLVMITDSIDCGISKFFLMIGWIRIQIYIRYPIK